MKCPRCQIETDQARCPGCGLTIQPPLAKASPENSQQKPKQEPIRFSISTTPPPQAEAEPLDWRSELRRKLQKHARNRGITPKSPEGTPKRPQSRKKAAAETGPPKAAAPTAPEGLESGQGKAGGEVERELFKYSLEDVEKQPLDRKIVTFAKARPHPAPLDRPLIRKPVKVQPAAKPPAGPEQRTLVLEVPAAGADSEDGAESVPEAVAPAATADRELSREILFSRLLAFIIDLMISAVAGFLFVLVGSLAVGAAFPTNESLILSAGCALIFLILDTVFFLFATGQTPGMAVTDLKLRGEEGGDPTLASVLLRTALFFPVAASGVGLLWSLWDPPRRCWHDRLSSTRVVPSRPEPAPRAAA